MLAPNILLTTVGMPETAEVWIRVVGLLAGVLGVYYFITAKYKHYDWNKINKAFSHFYYI